jgi:hypothetical protein
MVYYDAGGCSVPGRRCLYEPKITTWNPSHACGTAPRLSARLGCQLFVKRDDMTGIAFGGNKVRKLEFVLADALPTVQKRLLL